MSQNDFVIANQTAPNFRADLNLALQALASTSSGPTAPSTTYANMLWYDTANNILKMRSEADDAWIDLGTLDQSTNTFTPAGVAEAVREKIVSSGVYEFTSGDSSVDFFFDPTNLERVELVLDNVRPSTDGTALWLRLSDDGSTFEGDVADYSWALHGSTVAFGVSPAAVIDGDWSDNKINLTPADVGAASGELGVSGVVTICGPSSTLRTRATFVGTYRSNADAYVAVTSGGESRVSGSTVRGAQLLFSSGGLSAGTAYLRLYYSQ